MEQLLSIFYLVLFIVIWMITVRIYFKGKTNMDPGGIILFSYLIYSISSLFLFLNPYYSFNSINLFPFLYLYFLLMLATWPILRYDPHQVRKIQNPAIVLINSISFIYIIFSFIQLPSMFNELVNNIGIILFYSICSSVQSGSQAQ